MALVSEHKRLEAAGPYLAAIIENSDDAILSKNLDGIITSWNAGATRIFGYTAAEALGNPVSMLAPLDRMHEMERILDRIHEGKRVDPYDTVRRRKDGQAIHLSITVSPVRNASGEIAGASEIARDISGRKQAEQERARLLADEGGPFGRHHPRILVMAKVRPTMECRRDICQCAAIRRPRWFRVERCSAVYSSVIPQSESLPKSMRS